MNPERDKLLSTPAPFAPVSGMPKLKTGQPQTFVVSVDDSAIDRRDGENYYRFVGQNERIDVMKERKFHMVSEADLAKIVGHPIIADNDGKPILGDNDRKVVAAAFLLRFGIVENPTMSRKQKRRTLESLRGESMMGDLNGGGMSPPGDPGSIPRYGAEEIAAGVEPKLGFRDVIRDFSISEISFLLGRTIARTADGQFHDLTNHEIEVLGTVMGCLEMTRKAPVGRRLDLINESCRYLREEQGCGEAEVKRARTFLLKEARSVMEEKLAKEQADYVDLGRQKAALEEVAAWLPLEPKLQRPDGSAFSKVKTAVQSRDVIPFFVENRMPPELVHSLDPFAHSFVIEHDWAMAFKGATDFEGGETHLPFPSCAFEFQVNGKRVVIVLQEDERGTIALMLLGLKAGWALPMTYEFVSGRMLPKCATDNSVTLAIQKLADLVGANIRAVSITLEAEVAQTEVVRIPHRLNQARERRGKPPMNDYHVVSLAKRTRYLAREPGPLEEVGEYTRKRLHFRRGHYRHFPTYKIWIKWMLVGDPDLGFVDKSYRL